MSSAIALPISIGSCLFCQSDAFIRVFNVKIFHEIHAERINQMLGDPDLCANNIPRQPENEGSQRVYKGALRVLARTVFQKAKPSWARIDSRMVSLGMDGSQSMRECCPNAFRDEMHPSHSRIISSSIPKRKGADIAD